MKILMLATEYPPQLVGGLARVVHDLSQKLAEGGNEVHVITKWFEGSEFFEKDKNVFVHRVKTPNIHGNFIESIHHLNNAMTEYGIRLINEIGKFDVIHAHDWLAAFTARALKLGFGIPLVSTIHATEHGRNGGLHNDLQRYISSVEWWLCYESHSVICNSNYMRNEVNWIFQLPDGKVTVVPNGIEADRFKGYERDYSFRRNFAADNEKMILYVGRMVQEKGATILLDAIPKVLHYYNDAKFVFAGEGPQLEYLKIKADAMGISQRVYFSGYLRASTTDHPNMFKSADVTVFPSTYEPFGIVALEGMISGAPVVVSDAGGFDEIIDHGINGMKSYAGSANSLADSILALLHDKALADKCVKNAVEKVKNVYNWERIANLTLEVYKSAKVESKKADWKLSDLKDMVDKAKKISTSAKPKVSQKASPKDQAKTKDIKTNTAKAKTKIPKNPAPKKVVAKKVKKVI